MSKPSLSLSESRKQYFILVLVAGCLIGVVGFGPRSALGLFLPPMSAANGWGRDVFALALAIQILIWGAGLPFAGALADRFGIVLVMSGGAILYALGLVADGVFDHTGDAQPRRRASWPGWASPGSSFMLVMAAFGKLLPQNGDRLLSAPARRRARSASSCSRRSRSG